MKHKIVKIWNDKGVCMMAETEYLLFKGKWKIIKKRTYKI